MARSMGDRLRVHLEGVVLAEVDPASTPGVKGRAKAEARTAKRRKRLSELQERLFAERRRSLLVVLQGLDTSGKDGTIKHVFSSVNPQGTTVASFKVPTEQERRHHFLWRIRKRLPPPGDIGIFNRSHYEDVLVARVHGLAPGEEIERRYDAINRFERKLAEDGTTIVKLCLHISAEEQRRRLLARLEDETKRWKFNPADLDDRDRWVEFWAAYEVALHRCATEEAPWYVVPADHKWYRNFAVTEILVETLEELDPHYPQPVLDLAALRARLGAGG
jgi:PPK2 family polyphosphate:nucleotide phosphotransferase